MKRSFNNYLFLLSLSISHNSYPMLNPLKIKAIMPLLSRTHATIAQRELMQKRLNELQKQLEEQKVNICFELMFKKDDHEYHHAQKMKLEIEKQIHELEYKLLEEQQDINNNAGTNMTETIGRSSGGGML